jgi:hypothetical protein
LIYHLNGLECTHFTLPEQERATMTDQEKRPTLLQIIGSVLAAMFGVQSDKARARDFQFGSPWAYMVIGIVFVILLVLSIFFFVQFVLSYVKV